MTILFQIDTDLIKLSWSRVQKKEVDKSITAAEQYGLLRLKPKRKNITFAPPIYRINDPTALGSGLDSLICPVLYEQTNYKLFVQSKNQLN